jgi:RNA polymerase sigma-70 factor (ECF subfamily)
MQGISERVKCNPAILADVKPRGVVQNELNEAAALLLTRCKSGDAEAWNALIKKQEKPVYQFAFRLCRNRDDAADITGQALVHLYQSLHTLRCDAYFSSWMYRIVRNAYLDICVRPASRRNFSLDADFTGDGRDENARELEDPCPTPEAVYVENETSRILSRALRHLPAYQREVMRMYHTEGKSYEQIADATGLSIGTIKSRLFRARKMLRERLLPMREVLTT